MLKRGLGAVPGVVMGLSSAAPRSTEGNRMAEEEPLLTNPPTQDVAVHVRDYTRFTKLLKWGAIVSLITGLIVMMLIS